MSISSPPDSTRAAPAGGRRGRRSPLLVGGVGAVLALSLGFIGWRAWSASQPGQRHYLRGLDLMAAHNPKAALKEWMDGVREDPNDPACWEMVGDFYGEARQAEQAAAAYEQASRRARNNGPLYLKLSAALHDAGRRREETDAARRAAALLPNDPDAAGRYGLLLKHDKKRPEALALLRRAHQLRPDDRLYFIGLVEVEMDALQMAQAEADLNAFLKRHPDDPEACFKMAVVYNQKPRTSENVRAGIEYARKALGGLPGDARPYTVLGQLYLDSDRVQDALKLYLHGHAVAPTAESILRGLADCYTRLGQTRELTLVSAEYQQVLKRHDRIDHLTHVMGFNPGDVTSGLELARLTEEEGLVSKAEAYYQQLARQAPKDPRTRGALSGFYAREGRPDLARRAARAQFLQ